MTHAAARRGPKPKLKLAHSWESIGEKSARVDYEGGVIHDVCILGPVSIGLNGKVRRKYTEECMREAVPLYEGTMVNINHPAGHNPNVDRDLGDRFGKLVNVRFSSDGKIRGDLVANRKHSMFESVFEAAINPALHNTCGLSQAFEYEADYDPAGFEKVKKITRVPSVDLVADPATTRSLFESQGTRSKPMDEESTVGTGDMSQLPGEAAAAGGDDVWEGSAFDAALDEIGADVQSGKLDVAAATAKFKLACKLHGPEAKGGEGEESAKPAEEKPAKECAGEECAGKESRHACCTHEEAMTALESANVTVNAARVNALRFACESQADRESLIATWPTVTAIATESKGGGVTGAKPKSGTGTGGKPDSTPANPKHAVESKAAVWMDDEKAREAIHARR
jgi:hypothetical protein